MGDYSDTMVGLFRRRANKRKSDDSSLLSKAIPFEESSPTGFGTPGAELSESERAYSRTAPESSIWSGIESGVSDFGGSLAGAAGSAWSNLMAAPRLGGVEASRASTAIPGYEEATGTRASPFSSGQIGKELQSAAIRDLYAAPKKAFQTGERAAAAAIDMLTGRRGPRSALEGYDEESKQSHSPSFDEAALEAAGETGLRSLQDKSLSGTQRALGLAGAAAGAVTPFVGPGGLGAAKPVARAAQPLVDAAAARAAAVAEGKTPAQLLAESRGLRRGAIAVGRKAAKDDLGTAKNPILSGDLGADVDRAGSDYNVLEQLAGETRRGEAIPSVEEGFSSGGQTAAQQLKEPERYVDYLRSGLEQYLRKMFDRTDINTARQMARPIHAPDTGNGFAIDRDMFEALDELKPYSDDNRELVARALLGAAASPQETPLKQIARNWLPPDHFARIESTGAKSVDQIVEALSGVRTAPLTAREAEAMSPIQDVAAQRLAEGPGRAGLDRSSSATLREAVKRRKEESSFLEPGQEQGTVPGTENWSAPAPEYNPGNLSGGTLARRSALDIADEPPPEYLSGQSPAPATANENRRSVMDIIRGRRRQPPPPESVEPPPTGAASELGAAQEIPPSPKLAVEGGIEARPGVESPTIQQPAMPEAATTDAQPVADSMGLSAPEEAQAGAAGSYPLVERGRQPSSVPARSVEPPPSPEPPPAQKLLEGRPPGPRQPPPRVSTDPNAPKASSKAFARDVFTDLSEGQGGPTLADFSEGLNLAQSEAAAAAPRLTAPIAKLTQEILGAAGDSSPLSRWVRRRLGSTKAAGDAAAEQELRSMVQVTPNAMVGKLQANLEPGLNRLIPDSWRQWNTRRAAQYEQLVRAANLETGKTAEELRVGVPQENGVRPFQAREDGSVWLQRVNHDTLDKMASDSPEGFRLRKAFAEYVKATSGKEVDDPKLLSVFQDMSKNVIKRTNVEFSREFETMPAKLRDEYSGKWHDFVQADPLPNTLNRKGEAISQVERQSKRLALIKHFGQEQLADPNYLNMLNEQSPYYRSLMNEVNGPTGNAGEGRVRRAMAAFFNDPASGIISDSGADVESALHRYFMGSGLGPTMANAFGKISKGLQTGMVFANSALQPLAETVPRQGIRNTARGILGATMDRIVNLGSQGENIQDRMEAAGVLSRALQRSLGEAFDNSRSVESGIASTLRKDPTFHLNEWMADFNDEISFRAAEKAFEKIQNESLAGRLSARSENALELSRMPETYRELLRKGGQSLTPEQWEAIKGDYIRKGVRMEQFRTLPALFKARSSNSVIANTATPLMQFARNSLARQQDILAAGYKVLKSDIPNDQKAARITDLFMRQMKRVAGTLMTGEIQADVGQAIRNGINGIDRSDETAPQRLMNNLTYASFLGPIHLLADALGFWSRQGETEGKRKPQNQSLGDYSASLGAANNILGAARSAAGGDVDAAIDRILRNAPAVQGAGRATGAIDRPGAGRGRPASHDVDRALDRILSGRR